MQCGFTFKRFQQRIDGFFEIVILQLGRRQQFRYDVIGDNEVVYHTILNQWLGIPSIATKGVYIGRFDVIHSALYFTRERVGNVHHTVHGELIFGVIRNVPATLAHIRFVDFFDLIEAYRYFFDKLPRSELIGSKHIVMDNPIENTTFCIFDTVVTQFLFLYRFLQVTVFAQRFQIGNIIGSPRSQRTNVVNFQILALHTASSTIITTIGKECCPFGFGQEHTINELSALFQYRDHQGSNTFVGVLNVVDIRHVLDLIV